MGSEREELYNRVGYYCWFIPSCISTILSLIILIKIKKKLTILNLLEIIYCLGDILQCCALFIGPLYTLNKNNNKLCFKQEIIFEIGLFIKTSIAVLVSGLFASYTVSRENFTMSKIKIFFLVIISYTIISIILSYIFESRKAGCEGILNHNVSSIDRYEIAYLIFFSLPNGVFVTLTIIFSFVGLYFRKDDLSSALLSPIYDRLYVTLFIVVICAIQCFVYFMMISFGRMNIILYCITGIIICSTGTLFSFYHLYAPYLNKSHRFNLFFFLEILTENLTASDRIPTASSVVDNPISSSSSETRSQNSIFEMNRMESREKNIENRPMSHLDNRFV